ncbi:MAG: CAP domain-containing protein [Gammaproteobacteria bacterium]
MSRRSAQLARGWLVCVAAAGGLAAAAPDGETVLATQLAARLHAEVGAARQAAGLAPLAWDPALAAIAAAHSADMARRQYFAHASPDGSTFRARYAAANYDCRVQVGQRIHLGAENIAKREQHVSGKAANALPPWPDTARLARDIVADWMKSAGHRRNLLTPHWRREGIGVHATATEILVTQSFC